MRGKHFRLKSLIAVFALLTALVLAVAGTASPASNASKAQAVAAGWDCSPDIAIGGYFHSAAPGSPSLLDLITGAASPPSLHLNVYDGGTQLLAGTEELIRADHFRGQPCPQELSGVWSFLDFPAPAADYYGCHHFAA